MDRARALANSGDDWTTNSHACAAAAWAMSTERRARFFQKLTIPTNWQTKYLSSFWVSSSWHWYAFSSRTLSSPARCASSTIGLGANILQKWSWQKLQSFLDWSPSLNSKTHDKKTLLHVSRVCSVLSRCHKPFVQPYRCKRVEKVRQEGWRRGWRRRRGCHERRVCKRIGNADDTRNRNDDCHQYRHKAKCFGALQFAGYGQFGALLAHALVKCAVAHR